MSKKPQKHNPHYEEIHFVGVYLQKSCNHMVASMNNCATTRGLSGGILMFDDDE